MNKNIFFVGPASVGKSTCGKLLANHLGFNFVDIDLYFCDEIALIPDYIKEHGYAKYSERNSTLTDDLIERFPSKTVFATPSGFLVHEESPHLVEKHVKLIDTNAVSVLLLPSAAPKETVESIVSRQVARWSDVDPFTERDRYISRHKKYKEFGTIKAVGQYEPDEVIGILIKKLQSLT